MKRWIRNNTECRIEESPDEGFEVHIMNVSDHEAYKRKIARMCFVKYKGTWIFCHPPEDALEKLGITPDLLKEDER